MGHFLSASCWSINNASLSTIDTRLEIENHFRALSANAAHQLFHNFAFQEEESNFMWCLHISMFLWIKQNLQRFFSCTVKIQAFLSCAPMQSRWIFKRKFNHNFIIPSIITLKNTRSIFPPLTVSLYCSRKLFNLSCMSDSSGTSS